MVSWNFVRDVCPIHFRSEFRFYYLHIHDQNLQWRFCLRPLRISVNKQRYDWITLVFRIEINGDINVRFFFFENFPPCVWAWGFSNPARLFWTLESIRIHKRFRRSGTHSGRKSNKLLIIPQCWTVGAIFTFGCSRMFGPDKLWPLVVCRSRSRRIKKM